MRKIIISSDGECSNSRYAGIGRQLLPKNPLKEIFKQSQKRYMVSGSLCPLISFLDVSYSFIFVVRGSGPIGDDDLWYQIRIEA